MKKFFKSLTVLAAVAALGFGFASCSDGDDDDGTSGNGSSTSGSAVFQSTRFYEGTIQIEYKADGTFENGTIHQHQTHSSDTLSIEWVAEVEDNDLAVEDGKFTVDDIGVTFKKVGSSD